MTTRDATVDALVAEVRAEVTRKLAGAEGHSLQVYFDPAYAASGAVCISVVSDRVGYDENPVTVRERVPMWKSEQETAEEVQRATSKVALVFAKSLKELR